MALDCEIFDDELKSKSLSSIKASAISASLSEFKLELPMSLQDEELEDRLVVDITCLKMQCRLGGGRDIEESLSISLPALLNPGFLLL